MRRCVVLQAIVVCVCCVAATAAHGQTLKAAVSLAGSNATTDTMEVQVPAGRLALDLYLYATDKLPETAADGKLAVTNLRATSAPGDVLATKVGTADGKAGAANGSAFDIRLSKGEPLRVAISADNLRAATTYKSTMFLSALKETRQWELTLTSGAKGIVVADAVGALQFERPLGDWLCSRFEFVRCAPAAVGQFRFSLRNKSPMGPLSNLHVRFEPAATTSSKTVRSNFSIDNVTFSTTGDPLTNSQPQESTKEGKTGADKISLPGTLLDTPRWYTASLSRLEPGEYSGALRFSASEVADDAADSKLVLAINVRDPRAIPVTVLVVGSILGWFTTKYLVAARKARDMARAVQVLRDRADDLARGISARHGWQFSNEATSYTLAKIRVTLHKLAALTKSGLPMLVDETELTRLKDDAELRLTKLEALRDVRLQVQLVANNRPTVQRFVGRLLRRASDVLEQTVFGTAQQAAFTARMEELQPWLGGETLLQKYREALALRSESDNVGISVAGVSAPLQDHVKTLLDNWPPPSSLKAADTTIATLQPFDERFEKLALLIREQKASWVQLLADGCAAGNTLNELFRVVDEQFWETLKSVADTIVLRRESAHRTTVDVFVPVEVHLDVPDIDENRILKHPLNVLWTITSPGGTQRVVETENTTLVQYFSQTGTATIRAKLQWGGHEPIEIKHRFELTIAENTGYRWYDLFRQGGAPEIAAVAIAILFAVSTAMQTQYDSTFGSATQYLGLFLWAAGAATGGNVLKQLGTSNTPGGQTEATLPAKT